MASLQKLNLWHRRAPWLMAFAAAAIALGCHLFVQRPADHRLAQLRSKRSAAAGELSASRVALAEMPRIEREVEEVRRKLESARKLPQDQDLGKFWRDVQELGKEASLSKLGWQPGVPRKRELISEIPIALSFEGDFLGVCAFLRRAEEMPLLSAMRKLSIKTIDPTVGRVEVQLTMNVYFADGY